MSITSITILVDKADRGVAYVDAAQNFACCHVTSIAEKWDNASLTHGVIVDLPIEQNAAQICLRELAHRLSGRKIPIIFVLRNCDHRKIQHATKLGATACFPWNSHPTTVLAALFRQISPSKTLTDVLVDCSVARAGSFFGTMFDAGRTGSINGDAIGAGSDPILVALREGGIRRWLDAVRAHDDMTVRHCLLVAGLVANFAVHFGVPMADRIMLVRAGLVHDIGKARIPLAILNKPGPLDPDEMVVMRAHAVHGHDILLASKSCEAPVLIATRHHHELLDGSGYPDGLYGDQIEDYVRILTVCDVYAALTEHRSYRAAMPQSKAFEILRTMTPGKLERPIVEALAASLGHDSTPTAEEPIRRV